jgi:hypothetical protein
MLIEQLAQQPRAPMMFSRGSNGCTTPSASATSGISCMRPHRADA